MVNPAFLYKGLPPPGILAAGYTAATVALPACGIWWGLVFLWPALLYLAVSYAYLRSGTLGASLLGKRADTGTIPLARVLLFLPYLLTSWLVWWVRHALFLTREDGYNEVSPGVYLGRYPLWFPCRRRGSSSPFPKRPVAVVDLCAEFPALPWVVAQAKGDYYCLPCLDGDMPEDKEALLTLALKVAEWGSSREVYVHCANGRGRSCCFVALVMILREGRATSVEDAVAEIRHRRPQVNIQRAQRDLVNEVLQMHSTGQVELKGRVLGTPG